METTFVNHPMWAAWRIDIMYGCGLVVGWRQDEELPWTVHPIVAGAGQYRSSAGTPTTHPSHGHGARHGPKGYVPAVAVELFTDEQAARARADELHSEYMSTMEYPQPKVPYER